jgi:hypothetical protein
VHAMAAELDMTVDEMLIHPPNTRRGEGLPPGTKREIVNGQIIDIVDDSQTSVRLRGRHHE